MYIPIKIKFIITTAFGILWAAFSLWFSQAWGAALSGVIGGFWAWTIILSIAIIPGFMNAFMVMALLIDKRPKRNEKLKRYPSISILIAGLNEEKSIFSTLQSIERQDYPGKIYVYAINDGSTDNTYKVMTSAMKKLNLNLTVVNISRNVGKARALSMVSKQVKTPYLVTLDADSYLYKDALRNIVQRLKTDPENTAAVAGSVLVRNSRNTFPAKVQEWDYFHGISAVKRIQSLYQGTMVAQGAFSIYDNRVLRKVGKWPHCVGEDIVLTWAILKEGYRVGYSEDAIVFTDAPETWKQFIRQRQRWSRGMIEAFKAHQTILTPTRYSSMFAWWNFLFPLIDFAFTLAFIPGVILALFGYYYIAGPMTLLVLPLAMLVNLLMYRIQKKMFKEQGLKVRQNFLGFLFYSLFYSVILQPACVVGYINEVFRGSVKNWGTK